jgi:hypothetical protein
MHLYINCAVLSKDRVREDLYLLELLYVIALAALPRLIYRPQEHILSAPINHV